MTGNRHRIVDQIGIGHQTSSSKRSGNDQIRNSGVDARTDTAPVPVTLVAVTRLAPVPTAEAADMAVPLPCRNPLMVVDRVMCGVVVGLVIEKKNPLALMPCTSVTVPPPPLRAREGGNLIGGDLDRHSRIERMELPRHR